MILEVDDTQNLTWYADASFVMHPAVNSHRGLVFTLCKGLIISSSTKKKDNSRSPTEVELNATNGKKSNIIYTKRFLDYQNFEVHKTKHYLPR